MICIICKLAIPDARLEAQPATLTCSAACSAELSKRTRRASAQRWRDKQKASKPMK